MQENSEKKETTNKPNEKTKKHNLIYILAMATIILTGVSVLYMQYEYTLELNKKNSIVLKDIEKQNKLTEEINKQDEYYHSDEYVEKIAREQLSLVKPNEIVFVDLNK